MEWDFMREMIVGKNWVNLVVALGLAVVPLLVVASKPDSSKAAHVQVATVQAADVTTD